MTDEADETAQGAEALSRRAAIAREREFGVAPPTSSAIVPVTRAGELVPAAASPYPSRRALRAEAKATGIYPTVGPIPLGAAPTAPPVAPSIPTAQFATSYPVPVVTGAAPRVEPVVEPPLAPFVETSGDLDSSAHQPSRRELRIARETAGLEPEAPELPAPAEPHYGRRAVAPEEHVAVAEPPAEPAPPAPPAPFSDVAPPPTAAPPPSSPAPLLGPEGAPFQPTTPVAVPDEDDEPEDRISVPLPPPVSAQTAPTMPPPTLASLPPMPTGAAPVAAPPPPPFGAPFAASYPPPFAAAPPPVAAESVPAPPPPAAESVPAPLPPLVEPVPAPPGPPVGHWAAPAPADEHNESHDSPLARTVGATGAANTSSTLVVPLHDGPPLIGPIGLSGEVIVTGSLKLPSVGATGALPEQLENSAIDHVLDGTDQHQVVATSTTPVRAATAVSVHTPAAGVSAPRRGRSSSRPLTVLIIVAATMAVLVAGLVIFALVSGVF